MVQVQVQIWARARFAGRPLIRVSSTRAGRAGEPGADAAGAPSRSTRLRRSLGDRARTLALVERFPALEIYAGTEGLLLDALAAGGAGCISAGANVTVERARAVVEAHARGDTAGARAAQGRLSAARAVLERRPMVPVMKALLAPGLGAAPDVLPPLVGAAPVDADALRRELSAAGGDVGGSSGAGR